MRPRFPSFDGACGVCVWAGPRSAAGGGQDGVGARSQGVHGHGRRGPCCGCWCVTFGDDAACPGGWRPRAPLGSDGWAHGMGGFVLSGQEGHGGCGAEKAGEQGERGQRPSLALWGQGCWGKVGSTCPGARFRTRSLWELLPSTPQVGPSAGFPVWAPGSPCTSPHTPAAPFHPQPPTPAHPDTFSGCRCGAGGRRP